MDWVTGAFMIVPKKIFEEAGGFDKNIFMYTEEMELCYRISKLGYTALFQNKPAIIHLGGASGGSFLALTSEVENMIYFWKKHMPGWQLLFIRFAFFCGSLLRLLIFGIIKGDEKARRIYVKALRLTL
jgi:GT2 family glycosyltransferase